MSKTEVAQLESTIQPRKPSRVRKFKEDYANENAILRMDNHALKCMVEKLAESNALMTDNINNPSIRFAFALLVKAIVGNKEVGK